METKKAFAKEKLSADIIEEQGKLKEADLVIFQVEPRIKGSKLEQDPLPPAFLAHFSPSLTVSHVLVQCSCDHEGMD